MENKRHHRGEYKALEKRYKFKYLPLIAFENPEDRLDILNRGLKELKQGRISQERLELGQKYKTEIESGQFIKAEIRWIGRRVGYGLYAAEDVAPDTFVAEYTGIVRRNDRRYFEPLNNYCYEYPVPDSIDRSHVTDGTQGNLARFINHRDDPNLKQMHVFLDGFYHLIFVSNQKIKKGEQLFYDYGPAYWYIRPKPLRVFRGC